MRPEEQGTSDLALGLRLDELRLGDTYNLEGVLDVKGLDVRYSEAFRNAGLGKVGEPVEAVAARVKASRLRETFVAGLDDCVAYVHDASRRSWLLALATKAEPYPTAWSVLARDPSSWENSKALLKLSNTAPFNRQSVPLLLALQKRLSATGEDPVPFLKRIQKSKPDDFYTNFALGRVLMRNQTKTEEAIGYLRAALALRPRSIDVYNNLCIALMNAARFEDAVEELREALRVQPTYSKSAIIHCNFFQMLRHVGRNDEAISYITASLRCNALAANPINDHDAWYGYAELCLFVGQEEEYLRARRSLLAKFSATADPFVAERTSRACLLRAVSGDELNETFALAARVAALDRSKYSGVYHAFLFVKGLAEYRQAQYDMAIATMNGDASRALGPTPRLVIAMAQYRTGRVADAPRTLATAISTHDWRGDQIRDQDGWIWHIVRREAERLILPDLPALRDGTRQPRDNDERLAMLGGLVFANRFHDSTSLCRDAFAADPRLMQDLGAAHRYNAARWAAMAGCGHGAKGSSLGEPDRTKWRVQAREWLRADLAARKGAFDTDPTAASLGVRQALTRWRKEPDLACVRDPGELQKLLAGERKEWLALWAEVDDVLGRTQK